MAIIADEVFLDYFLGERVPVTFSANAEALTFTLSGLSKISGLPQMKVAWVAATGPEALKREALARLAVIADTYLSMNAPAQLALPTMLARAAQYSTPAHAANSRRISANSMRNWKPTDLCRRLAVEGGWYAVLRVPVLGSDEELAIALLRATGVLLHPGHFYNFPGDGYLVASLITPEEDFAEGIRQLLGLTAVR